jgi:hypothetical protein
MGAVTRVTVAQAQQMLRSTTNVKAQHELESRIQSSDDSGFVDVDTKIWQALNSGLVGKALAQPWSANGASATERRASSSTTTGTAPATPAGSFAEGLKKASVRELAGIYMYWSSVGDTEKAKGVLDELRSRPAAALRSTVDELESESEARTASDLAKIRADPNAEIDQEGSLMLSQAEVLLHVLKPSKFPLFGPGAG